jgi:hypothetical protein
MKIGQFAELDALAFIGRRLKRKLSEQKGCPCLHNPPGLLDRGKA